MDTLTPSQRSDRMGRIKSKDTKPEMLVRRMVHGLGYRYRLHRRDLPGCPDLCFGPLRKVIFVHGCFWHRHDEERCRLTRLPKTRVDFWKTKLEANRDRDRQHQASLSRRGWQFLVVWECELLQKEQLRNKLTRFLEGRGDASIGTVRRGRGG